MKALILVDDGFEDLTLFLPWYRLREEGTSVVVACPFLHAVTMEWKRRIPFVEGEAIRDAGKRRR